MTNAKDETIHNGWAARHLAQRLEVVATDLAPEARNTESERGQRLALSGAARPSFERESGATQFP